MTNNVDKISDMEAEIMKIIWSEGKPTTYAEIREKLNKKFNMGNQSIQTMLKRLVTKQILEQEKREVYYYTALVTESEYVKSKTISFVDRVFGGDTKGLLTALVSYKEISPDDLKDLQDYWEKGRDNSE